MLEFIYDSLSNVPDSKESPSATFAQAFHIYRFTFFIE